MKKILETPSLEEVQNYFKDAKEVECLTGLGFDNIEFEPVEYEIDCYWIGNAKVWDCSQGYAEIIK